MNVLAVKHNIEVAHRLSQLEGKCENIHGHSMWVTLRLYGLQFDDNGILGGFNFTDVKKAFRSHLDTTYDHRLLLNEKDPLLVRAWDLLPGLRECEGDPTTENIARWIHKWAQGEFGIDKTIGIEVWETSVNMAEVVS